MADRNGNGRPLKVAMLVLAAVGMAAAGAAAYSSLCSVQAATVARVDGLERDVGEIKLDVKELLRRTPAREDR